MDSIREASTYREAAAQCRKAALTAINPRDWIDMAEQWEWLADTAGGRWLLLPTAPAVQDRLSAPQHCVSP